MTVVKIILIADMQNVFNICWLLLLIMMIIAYYQGKLKLISIL
jgi:hypothetical protein